MLLQLGSTALITLVAYLWGSIPTGYWLGKILRGKNFDIREHGSKKTGATNVQRTLGNVPALITFIVDISKGVGPALLAMFVFPFTLSPWSIFLAGVAAFLGHCFPVFIGFKGGRGVLTGAGAILVASPLAFIIGAIGTVTTIATTRFVSLGSIIGSVITILCGILFYTLGQLNTSFSIRIDLPHLLLMVIVPALIILFHKDNISRLLSGTERKLGSKASSTPTTTPAPK